MADEDLVVEVEKDDQTETETPETEEVAQQEQQVPEVDPGVDLRSQYEEAQRAAQAAHEREFAAQRRAEQLQREAERYRTESVDSQGEAIASALAAAEAEASNGEAAYASAMEKGEFTAAAKAQRAMANAEAKIVRLNEAKDYLEAQRKQQPQRQEQAGDQVEAFISRVPTEASRQWLRAHRDYITDQTKWARLQKAHFHAVGEDLVPDSPEYFKHIETRLGMNQPVAQQQAAVPTPSKANGGEAPKPRKSAAPPAAPVNGGGGAYSGGASGNVVRLTRIEAAAANDGTIKWNAGDLAAGRIKDKSKIGQPIGNEEFARRKRQMIAEGRYDKGN